MPEQGFPVRALDVAGVPKRFVLAGKQGFQALAALVERQSPQVLAVKRQCNLAGLWSKNPPTRRTNRGIAGGPGVARD
jgi:hypothetical protein